MAFRRARSIDRLNDLVDGYDRVLTADAPLALALNRRADRARLGDLAATPRNFAKQGIEVADRRELFHAIVARTDLSFKQAATLLDTALTCWEQTGDAEAVLDTDRHDTPEMRAVLDTITSVETGYSLREEYAAPETLDLAVIDPEGFSALDRRVLPDDYDAIDPFEPSGNFRAGEIDLLPSALALAETLEAHLTPANAGDVGIVLDPSGPVRPILEATLEARSIPYHTEEALAEHPALRSLLRALRLGLSPQRLRGRDVRGVLAELGRPLAVRDDERLVHRLDRARVDELEALWDELPGLPLGQALDAYRSLVPGTPRELAEIVDDLDLAEAPVDAGLLDALEFYLDTFPVERDYTREGVLLASGRDNAYVDRPLVFYVGLGADWARSIPDEPWLSPDARARLEARDLARFERLLQSGNRRVYLAQDTRRGKPVTPCFYLHELLDADFERFAELPSRKRAPPEPSREHATGFQADPDLVDVEPTETRTLSSHDLDRLTYCPRDWFMDQLVPEPETPWLRRGQIFHEFAELIASDPDAVDVHAPDQLDAVVEIALDELDDLVDPDDQAAQATELAIGFQAIADWLDANPPADEVPEGYQAPPPDRRGDNRFAEALDVGIDRSRTERWFDRPDLGVHGKVDLVHGPEKLVDWKSTRNPPSLRETVRKTRVDAGEGLPGFQPGVYLVHHRSGRPESPLAFTFVDLLGGREDAIRGQASPDDVTRQLAYQPTTFAEHAATREVYETVVKTSQRRKDVFAAVPYAAYRGLVQKANLPPMEGKDQAVASDFADQLVDLARDKRGAPAKSEKAAHGAVKQLVELKAETLYAPDLDRLADHGADLLDRLEHWRRGRFPVPEDVDGDELAHRDLVLEDLTRHRRPREGSDG